MQLLPFVFDHVEYLRLEEFSEILGSYTNVNVIVDLNGNSYGTALSDAEAARKDHLVLEVIFLHSPFKKLNDLGGASQMTG